MPIHCENNEAEIGNGGLDAVLLMMWRWDVEETDKNFSSQG
jgi:hypothetical protein